jgi:hypothetical protein
MGKQTPNRIKKILSVLLLVSFVIFVTAASASARNVNISPPGSKGGYDAGYQNGYKSGYDIGHQDCLKYGKKGTLTKIPAAFIKDNWTEKYKKDYKDGFKIGYISGYHSERYKCLKK